MSEKKTKAKREIDRKIDAAKARAYDALRQKEALEQILQHANRQVQELEAQKQEQKDG